MRALPAILVALACSACGSDSSPVAPTPVPIPPANIAATGNLSVNSCFAGANGVFNCSAYSGVALNAGAGCAANVRGVTTTFDAATRAMTGSSGWSYTPTVRPGEQIAYSGTNIVVQGPLTSGWAYTTSVSWDAVRCP